jgi:SAM-dependent methyltransferase
MSTYIFDATWAKERDRLRALQGLFDDRTTSRLAELGVTAGWRCLEIGAGAGGVAEWLADRVGPTGRVVATDLDTRFLQDHGRDNLEVWQHNVANDPLDDDAFDLAHARALLEHIPEREKALRRVIAAVRPGGWLLMEDVDFAGDMGGALSRYVRPSEHRDLFAKLFRGIETLFRARGADAGFGARLPGTLVDAGLIHVQSTVYASVVAGGTENWVRGTLEQLGGPLVQTGLATTEEVDQGLALMVEPSTLYATPCMVSAWGQRPT